MRTIFHAEAEDEHYQAAEYYAHASAQLADRYMQAVERGLQRIADGPLQFARYQGDVRRLVLSVFPYSVLYTLEPDCIFIVAIMHSRRKPGYWRERLTH
jgi:plasmid stabilization system protein ParE